MSDQALVWKFAFGVLVLVFCSVAFLTRKEAEPMRVLMPVPAAAQSAAPPAAQPRVPLDAAAPLQTADPAPADVPDVPDVQDAPVRTRVSPPQPVVVKKHLVARHPIRKVVHRRHRRPSPYLAGRQHYPFDPRERWLSPLG